MELLAPAGNFEALRAAVACGADAVYLGGEKFGARAGASNFCRENLARAIAFAHLRGVKIYLTVNTLLKDEELDAALALVKNAYREGVDAFIVQDMGLVRRVRETLPSAVLHASTQMGVCNAYGAQFVKDLGCTRVVLARETLPEDIVQIRQKTGLEIEMFCQGALCVAYSGNCYYSSLVSGCSGNRGRCLQLCRKKYKTDTKSGYFLSAKDICLLDKVSQLKEWGVHSLKIEGRMRSPEYVAETVSVYRAAIDGKPTEDGLQRLKKVFNRGDYCAAYTKRPTEAVIYPKVQNHIGVSVGKVVAVKNGKATLSLHAPLQKGDGVKYLRNGCETGGGYIDGMPTGYTGNVRVGDDVRLTVQASLKERVAAMDTRIPAELSVELHKDTGAMCTLSCRGQSVTIKGQGQVEPAAQKALSKYDVCRAVGTLGGTDFVADVCRVGLDDNIFYPVSAIKDMRKRAVAELSDILRNCLPEKRELPPFAPPSVQWFSYKPSAVFVMVPSADVLGSLTFAYDHVILHPNDYLRLDILQRECMACGGKALLDLPYISRGEDVDLLWSLKELPIAGVVANNVSHYAIFSKMPFLCGLGLNTLNRKAAGAWIDSIESDRAVGGIRYVYGKPPLMHFAHCPKQTQGGICKDCNGYSFSMRDDKGAVLQMHRIKEKYCYGVLVPQTPINTIDRKRNGSILLDFTYATQEEICAVNEQMSGKTYTMPHTHGNIDRKLQ